MIVEVYDAYGTLNANVHYPEGGIVFRNKMTNGNALNDSPDTGDNTPIFLYLAILLLGGAGLGGLLLWRKKKAQSEE